MIDQIAEGIPITFSREGSGKSANTEIRIESERIISTSGQFGDISEADVSVISGKRSRAGNFIIKRFKSVSDEINQRNAEAAFQVYRLAKDAGLKVFRTYRLGEDKKSILMTNGTAEPFLCIGFNEDSKQLEDFGQPNFDTLSREELVRLSEELVEQAKLASAANISIGDDSYFFLIDATTRAIDFVIGDLDGVLYQPDRPRRGKTSIAYNIDQAESILDAFVSNNVTNDEECANLVHEIFNGIRERDHIEDQYPELDNVMPALTETGLLT